MVLNPISSTGQQAQLTDHYVGAIAKISMVGATLFVILQAIIWIPYVVIALMFPEMGLLSKEDAEVAGLFTFALAELCAIVFLVSFVKNRMPQNREASLPEMDIEGKEPIAFTEKQLETAIVGMAFGAGLYVFFTGHSVFAVKIALIVIEAFAFVFMTIFLLTRWAITKEVRFYGLAGVLLTLISLWMLANEP